MWLHNLNLCLDRVVAKIWSNHQILNPKRARDPVGIIFFFWGEVALTVSCQGPVSDLESKITQRQITI